MKINTKEMSYEEVLKLPRLQHKKPMKPQGWLAAIVRIVCTPTLKKVLKNYLKKVDNRQPFHYCIK